MEATLTPKPTSDKHGNDFTHYTDTYKLDRFTSRHSAADFGGNIEVADIAGKLYDRWTGFDYIAERTGYSDELCNREAEAAYRVYQKFTGMFFEASHIYNTAVRVLVAAPQVIGNRNGHRAALPEMVK
jgi:hypothetical protein